MLLAFLVTGCNQIKSESHNYFYMDTYINVKIYDDFDSEKIFAEIDKIYKKYHELTDRYHEYPNLKNVYYLKNNNDNLKTIKLDEKLCDMIEIGLDYTKKTGNKFDINLADVLDVWASYREKNNGIPTLEELKAAKTGINPIIFKSKCEVLNNHPSIDLGAIAKGYATEEVGKYLKNKNINKFIINAGGNVLVGSHYANDKYKIGLETPNQFKEIYKILKVENKSVVTSGGYERFYIYEGKNYHHIIDAKTLFPANNFKSVTVITSSSALADTLSTSLFLLSIEDGKKLIDNMDVSVIWYTLDDKIINEVINIYE